jgi:hypothetical protein
MLNPETESAEKNAGGFNMVKDFQTVFASSFSTNTTLGGAQEFSAADFYFFPPRNAGGFACRLRRTMASGILF